jgi:hypothetical protein
MRRKGELSPAAIDRDWPIGQCSHRRPAKAVLQRAFMSFAKDLSLCARRHEVHDKAEWSGCRTANKWLRPAYQNIDGPINPCDGYAARVRYGDSDLLPRDELHLKRIIPRK